MRYRIRKWLDDNGSAISGLDLLMEAGDTRSSRRLNYLRTKAYIQADEKKSIRTALLNILAKMADTEDEDTEDDPQRVKWADTPRIMALREEGRRLMKVRSDLKSRLVEMSVTSPEKYTDDDRFEVARLIVEENVPELDRVYGAIRKWEREGIEPPGEQDKLKKEIVDSFKELLILRPKVSRLRSALALASEAEMPAIQQELDEMTDKIQELEQYLAI